MTPDQRAQLPPHLRDTFGYAPMESHSHPYDFESWDDYTFDPGSEALMENDQLPARQLFERLSIAFPGADDRPFRLIDWDSRDDQEAERIVDCAARLFFHQVQQRIAHDRLWEHSDYSLGDLLKAALDTALIWERG